MPLEQLRSCIMVVGDARMFPGFFKPVLNTTFFLKPPTTFLTCFSRGERQKYTGKKVCQILVSNSHPPGHKSIMLTTEPPGGGGGGGGGVQDKGYPKSY